MKHFLFTFAIPMPALIGMGHSARAAGLPACDPAAERVRLNISSLEETPITDNQITKEELPDGRLRYTIVHKVLRGVTRSHLDWWFKNMANSIPSKITNCKPYILLDDDHVSIEGTNTTKWGELRPGSSIRFAEDLEHESDEFEVSEEFYIPVIAPGHLVFEKYMLGIRALVIDRTYTDTPEGVQLTTVLTAGFENSWAVINRTLIGKLFGEQRQEAWKAHTSQEIGALETLLPWLIEHWL